MLEEQLAVAVYPLFIKCVLRVHCVPAGYSRYSRIRKDPVSSSGSL